MDVWLPRSSASCTTCSSGVVLPGHISAYHIFSSPWTYLNMSTPSTEYVVIILWSIRHPLPQLLVPEQNSITLINNRRTGDPPLSQKKEKRHMELTIWPLQLNEFHPACNYFPFLPLSLSLNNHFILILTNSMVFISSISSDWLKGVIEMDWSRTETR